MALGAGLYIARINILYMWLSSFSQGEGSRPGMARHRCVRLCFLSLLVVKPSIPYNNLPVHFCFADEGDAAHVINCHGSAAVFSLNTGVLFRYLLCNLLGCFSLFIFNVNKCLLHVPCCYGQSYVINGQSSLYLPIRLEMEMCALYLSCLNIAMSSF